MKLCKGCQQEKPLDEFYLSKANLYGRSYFCKVCIAARYARKPYRTKSPEQRERARESSRKWKQNNRERWLDYSATYKEAHYDPDAQRRYNQRWKAKNPDKISQYDGRRRALKAGSALSDFTAEQWQEVLDEFGHICSYCLAQGVPLQQDHVQPISKGGLHTKSNIVPACGPCNNRKNAQTLLEFARKSVTR